MHKKTRPGEGRACGPWYHLICARPRGRAPLTRSPLNRFSLVTVRPGQLLAGTLRWVQRAHHSPACTLPARFSTRHALTYPDQCIAVCGCVCIISGTRRRCQARRACSYGEARTRARQPRTTRRKSPLYGRLYTEVKISLVHSFLCLPAVPPESSYRPLRISNGTPFLQKRPVYHKLNS